MRTLTATAALVLAGLLASVDAYVLRPQRWPGRVATYQVNPANDDGLSVEALVGAVQEAAAAWSTQATPRMTLVYGGLTSTAVVARDGVSAVFFRPETNASVMAETFVWWDGAGNLVDADGKFYDAGFRFFATPTGCSGGDYVLDVATHEFGHVLGLRHSDVSVATMWPNLSVCGTTWRSLHADDIAGVQAQYPWPAPQAPDGLRVWP